MHKDEFTGDLTESELRALVPQLQSLTEKYKRSERIQKALFHISELASSLQDFENLYPEIHRIVADFMVADNIFVAFHEANDDKIQFAYFVDERDEEMVQTVPYEKIKNGITAHILRSGENLIMTKENFNALQSKYGFQVLGTPPVDLMGVPLMRDDQIIGAMVVQSYTDHIRYDADDLEILVFISQHIVTARDRVIQRDITEKLISDRTAQLLQANATLESEITERKRMEQLQKALFDISELSAGKNEHIIDVYAKLHAILQQLIHAKNCYVAVLDEAGENLEFPYFKGRDSDYSNTRKLTRGLTEYVIRSKKTLLVDTRKVQQLIDNEEVEYKFVVKMIEDTNSWMGAPLIVDSQVKGVIAVQTYGESRDYDEADLDLLRFVSQHISVAIERFEAANELINYNQQLSAKVLERTEALHNTNKSLKKQIEQRKEIELKLIHDAHHDGLTGLPNRVMFTSRLELAIASKQRYLTHNYALLFIDLDRFKTINDTLGHQAGDEFLIEAASRITTCKRGIDLLARLGGDEFVVLVDNYKSLVDVETIAQRIVDAISSPFKISNTEVFSGASIGIAEITDTYKDGDEVLRDADAAMYQAKHLGRNRYVKFDISMRKQLLKRIDDERAFREAYNNGDFEYQYQAVRSLDDNSVLFYECSVYWSTHKKIYSSSGFWALADKCGLTHLINKALLEETFIMLNSWRKDPQKQYTKIGLSLSIEHLLHQFSFEELVQQIEQSDIKNELLVIEVSEVALSRFSKYLPVMLNKLRLLGVNLILDDFGSQSGSLNHLFKYDFDYIKLSESLVNTFGMSDKYHRLVKSILLIANQMDIGVIGDGVGDEMILQDLVEIGCHFGQGELIESACHFR